LIAAALQIIGNEFWQSADQVVKEGKQITLSSSNSITATDFKYSMSGKVISITYLGMSSINEEVTFWSRCIRKNRQLASPSSEQSPTR
jgi:hypothetical protein